MAKQPQAFEVIYSRQRTGFRPDAAYSNPRFFTSPRQGVTKVYLVGDWPKIREAYEALGVPVEQLDPALAVSAASVEAATAPATLVPGAEDATRAETYIPDNWRELPWTGSADTLTLRQLGALVSPVPVLRKADAIAAIEAELARRAAAAGPEASEPEPEPEPETGEPE